MKKFFLSCLTGLLCAAWGQAQITGGDFENGYRAVYLSSAPPQVTETEGHILPEVSNADQLARLVEVAPGSNTYSGYCTSADIQEYYIYTTLAADGTFAGENCIGLAAEKTFSYADKDVIMQKASLKEGPQCHPLRFQEYRSSGYRMLVDLNEMAIYVESNLYSYIQVKGHEDETSYKNFENVSKIGGYSTTNLRAHLTEGQEIRVVGSLIPYSSYFSYGEIANILCAPHADQTVQLNDNGITFLTESYEWEPVPTYGWWKITKTGDYLMNQTVDNQDSEMFAVMKFMEIGSVKELYISENGNTDMTDPDNIFNWQSYQVPSADRKDSWEVKLLPVEGQPGVFAGDVNFAYHSDWKMLGVSCFDTFRTDDNAKYISMSVYAADLERTNNLCAGYRHPYNDGGASRIGVYYPGITERVTSRLVIDINKGTVEAEIEPENYEAIVPFNSSEVLYLVGKPSGWTVNNIPKEWQLGADENGVYVRTFYIEAGEFMLRFYTSLGNWDLGSIGCQYADMPADCEFSSEGAYSGICCDGKGSWNFPDWPGGYVTMEVDIAGGHVKFTKADAVPEGEPVPGAEVLLVDLYDNVTLTGDFGNVVLTNDPSSPYNYTGVIDIPAGEHTFGIVADGMDIGAWKDGRLVPIEKNAHFFQRYYLDNTNLWATPDHWEGGKVVVDMNLLTHNISFKVPQPVSLSSFPEVLELIGEFNNWAPVEALPLPHLGDGIYEGTFSLEADLGEFKFRKLNSWEQNIGALYTPYNTFFTDDSPSTLQGTSNGGNFKFSDRFQGGDVKFHINLNDMTVTASSSADAGISVPSANTAAISAAEGKIVVTGMAGTELRIYDLSGQLVLDVTPATDSATYTLAPGFYIAAGHKLIVK